MDPYDSPLDLPYTFYDELFHDFGNASKQPTVGRHIAQGDLKVHTTDPGEIQLQKEELAYHSAIMSWEWLREAEANNQVVQLYPEPKFLQC